MISGQHWCRVRCVDRRCPKAAEGICDFIVWRGTNVERVVIATVFNVGGKIRGKFCFGAKERNLYKKGARNLLKLIKRPWIKL